MVLVSTFRIFHFQVEVEVVLRVQHLPPRETVAMRSVGSPLVASECKRLRRIHLDLWGPAPKLVERQAAEVRVVELVAVLASRVPAVYEHKHREPVGAEKTSSRRRSFC